MGKNVAVVGAGSWGQNLIRNFHALKALYLICDCREEALKNPRRKYAGVKVATDYRKVLEDKNVQAVVLATPAATHYQMAKEALLYDKHVLAEKPLALKSAEGEELVNLAKLKGKILMVGHLLYHHPAIQVLKKLMTGGELGRIRYIYSNRLNIGKIRSEENILWSFAPHDISVIMMLLEEFPERVTAHGGIYLQHEVADVTMTTLDFPNGVKAHIFVSWLHPFKEQKLVVVGDKQMAVFDDLARDKILIYPHRIKWVNKIPLASRASARKIPVKNKEPLRLECRHFLESIKNNTLPLTDGAEGVRVLKVLEACQQSLNQKGKSIDLTVKRPYFVHESAYIDEGVKIGKGTRIWHFSHILKGPSIGQNCNIGQNVCVGPDVIIGRGCKIQNNMIICKGVTLEDYVFLGPSVGFTNIKNPRSEIPRKDEFARTLVKKGASIGVNASIICGHTIGRYALVGAGAVVTRDVPDHALFVGNPASLAGWVCLCGQRLKFIQDKAVCGSCGAKFKKINGSKIKRLK